MRQVYMIDYCNEDDVPINLKKLFEQIVIDLESGRGAHKIHLDQLVSLSEFNNGWDRERAEYTAKNAGIDWDETIRELRLWMATHGLYKWSELWFNFDW